MITLPLSELIKTITEKAGITPEEVNEKIKKKLKELSGLISEEGAAHIVANELGVTFDQPEQRVTIDKLQVGMKGLEVTGKVRQKYEVRTFTSARGEGKVGNFLLTDETGTTRIVLWNDHTDYLADIEVGDIVRLKNVYARKNNERVELHLGHEASLEKNPEGVKVDVTISTQDESINTTKKISELTDQDQNVTIIATIVQVFEPRFFTVCPQCNARVKEEEGKHVCASHGEVEPSYNYVMNLFLDDGTNNIRTVLWRQQVEKTLEKNKEELIAMNKEEGSFEQYKSDLLGVIVKIRGKVQTNQTFGQQELVAYDIELNVEPEEETKDKPSKETIIEKEEVNAVVDDGKVEVLEVKKESIAKEGDEEEVFTLDDIEDLESLDE